MRPITSGLQGASRMPWRVRLTCMTRRGAAAPVSRPPILSLQRQNHVRGMSTESPKDSGYRYAQTPLAIAIAIGATATFGGMYLASRNRGNNKGKEAGLVTTVNSGDKVGNQPVNTHLDISKLPKELANLTNAPYVPPPITRDYPVLLQVPLETSVKVSQLSNQYKYEKWTFNGTVPGPFIRARVGDVVELTLTNRDETGNPHNIDCHAFTGPGGGAALTTAEENETKTGRFRLMQPGLYVYHCAAAPVPVHIANGMYGLIYVQPEEGGLAPVDHEYYVMQSEFYHEPPEIMEDGKRSSVVEFSYPRAVLEDPNLVVFNGSESALTRDNPLKAHSGESVRIFFGNIGPNLTSSFHVIGSIFDKLYRDGSVVDPPSRHISTTSVPAGGAAIVDMNMSVPGTYTLVDHAIFRLDKGAIGYLNVSGKPRHDIYQSDEPAAPCTGCKLHP